MNQRKVSAVDMDDCYDIEDVVDIVNFDKEMEICDEMSYLSIHPDDCYRIYCCSHAIDKNESCIHATYVKQRSEMIRAMLQLSQLPSYNAKKLCRSESWDSCTSYESCNSCESFWYLREEEYDYADDSDHY